MSRIEKAIEAAAVRRNEGQPPDPSQLPVAVKDADVKRPLVPSAHNTGIVINNPYLTTANDQDAPASEQYRKLKSVLAKLSQVGDFGKALVISSSVAGEGKTITSLNLAITMAQDFDNTVLLVEADIRKPSVLHYLGIGSERGLTDCVLDKTDISEVLIKTGLGNLTVLPAGRHVNNPVELFSSKRMKAIFDEIKTRYNDRYVIVDTTPLLPFAEPSYIASMIGAVLLVAREGVTTPDKLKRSIAMLKDHNLLGVVYNGVSRVHSMQGYYGYYGYR